MNNFSHKLFIFINMHRLIIYLIYLYSAAIYSNKKITNFHESRVYSLLCFLTCFICGHALTSQKINKRYYPPPLLLLCLCNTTKNSHSKHFLNQFHYYSPVWCFFWLSNKKHNSSSTLDLPHLTFFSILINIFISQLRLISL
jgi:hypothetical protein